MKDETIVFIHGLGGSNASWEEWAQEHFGIYNLVFIELPGHGNTPNLNKNDYQSWLTYIEDQIPSGAHIIGWSLGGLLAQDIALENPSKYSSLTLLGAPPAFSYFSKMELVFGFIDALKKAPVRECLSKKRRATLKSYIYGACFALSKTKDKVNIENLRDKILKTDLKIAYVFGGKDPLVDLKEMITTGEVTGKSIKLIPQTGHFPHKESPQSTARAIKENITYLYSP